MADVLVIDDEEALVELYAYQLQLGGHVTVEFNQSAKAMIYLQSNCPDMIVTDLRMPQVSGIEICRFARKLYPGVKLIVVSGFSEVESELRDIGVEAVLKKPFSLDLFALTVQRVLDGKDSAAEKSIIKKAS